MSAEIEFCAVPLPGAAVRSSESDLVKRLAMRSNSNSAHSQLAIQVHRKGGKRESPADFRRRGFIYQSGDWPYCGTTFSAAGPFCP